MTLYRTLALMLISAVMLAACQPTPIDATTPTPRAIATQTLAVTAQTPMTTLSLVTGQTVFVPAYAEVFYGSDEHTLPLTTTLAIHNADPTHEILVTSIRYYDTDGTLVRQYVETPLRLKPMATKAVVIEPKEGSGGWGANFLVDWGAEQPVYEPVIEAVMVSRQGTEGVSFISEGRVLTEKAP